MKNTLLIILIIVVVLVAYYYLIYKPGKVVSSTVGGSHIPNLGNLILGEGTATLNPALSSVHVNKGEVSFAQTPNAFFDSIQESTAESFNLLQAPGSNPAYIHVTNSFNQPCDQFIWYKKWLYTLIKSETSERTSAGERTCYYKVDKSLFPTELKIQRFNPTCANFHYYLSGVEYKYKQSTTETVPIGQPKMFCIYEKV